MIDLPYKYMKMGITTKGNVCGITVLPVVNMWGKSCGTTLGTVCGVDPGDNTNLVKCCESTNKTQY